MDIHFSDFYLKADDGVQLKSKIIDSWKLDDEEKKVLEINNGDSNLFISLRKVTRSGGLGDFLQRSGVKNKNVDLFNLNGMKCEHVLYLVEEVFEEWWVYGDRLIACFVLRGREDDCMVLREVVSSINQYGFSSI